MRQRGYRKLDKDWLFGSPMSEGADQPEFDDGGFERVAVPHANAMFSWRNIDRGEYENVAIYRHHFSVSTEMRDQRVFVDFEGVMGASTVTINGVPLPEYKGGYTPFSFELTPHLEWDGDNVLAVKVDSRRSRSDVPPLGGTFPSGHVKTDFDTFGGIQREVSLRAVPQTFIENVFAKPVDALGPDPRLDIKCFLDGTDDTDDDFSLEVEVRDGNRVVAVERTETAAGNPIVELSIGGLTGIELWDVDNPKLYDVTACLLQNGEMVHSYETRVGFREARFEREGFFLNGRRLTLFGLNRHELFPYVGGAMPERVQRRDAEILKHELNCNIVRTSHYVQSPHFIDACDELGLLVWDEIPGWQHVGDETWQEVAAEHARKMIRRDWNHPSVILWAVRINESSEDYPEFYDALNQMAHELDDSRQTTGAYNHDHPLREDVWGHNDYGFKTHEPPGDAPYLISEAVGQIGYGFTGFYRRVDSGEIQQAQARRHAHAHHAAAKDRRCSGVTAWCAFDYNSPQKGFRDVKTPGVCDIFRIPKPAAGFYHSQRDPGEEVVIEPAFYWDFGPDSPTAGPGKDAMICSNCERLEVYVDDEHFSSVAPDYERYGNLPYPPFFLDLTVDGTVLPKLRIEGYIGGSIVVSRSFSADTEGDFLLLQADDEDLLGDGIDSTRIVFRAVDRYGAPRPFVKGDVSLEVEGPGEIIGDNSFAFEEAGGAGAVWIRAFERRGGEVRVRASHETLGAPEARIQVHQSPDDGPPVRPSRIDEETHRDRLQNM